MSQSVFQPAKQATTKQQQYNHIAKHLLVDGKPADAETVRRVANAKEKPVSSRVRAPQPRPFSLL